MAMWHRIQHPCVWLTAADLPRLRANAQTDFWRPKFEAWRNELADLEHLWLPNRPIDFHRGDNEQALKAALCHVVDGDDRSGRLVASFLEDVVAYYRDVGHTWPLRMAGWDEWGWHGSHGRWGGLNPFFIIDGLLFHSMGHLYDVIYGKGYMTEADAKTFEEMMGWFHRLCCLHEDIIKLDNNRGVILNGASYLSTLFDEDEVRAEFCRERALANQRTAMTRFLDDGTYYEIGSYAWGTVAVLEWSARLMRNVAGVDFYTATPGVAGLEAALRAWAGTLIPGPALRRPRMDLLNHWESVCAGYREYGIPELGWAISRLADHDWVPLFRHWSQGSEFYAYDVPDAVQPPHFLDSHFPDAGYAILRSSWANDARSLYFRYGFQGSSHGGGLDKLNIELHCNGEALLVSDSQVERSHFKNVVLVDFQNQEQCSGMLLRADVASAGRVSYLTALGGLGRTPDYPALHDPRIEFGYWSTKSEECFPGKARMRRTVALVDRRYFVVRDTLLSLDGDPHAYQWLFQTQAAVQGLDAFLGRFRHTYVPRKISLPDPIAPETRTTDRHRLTEPGRIRLAAPRASLDLRFVVQGTEPPATVDLWSRTGSPPGGPTTTLQFELLGKDLVVTTVLDARPAGEEPYVTSVRTGAADGPDRLLLEVARAGGSDLVAINEADDPWMCQGRVHPIGVSLVVDARPGQEAPHAVR